MRLGIVSDTHGDAAAWETVAALFGTVDLVVHAGDVLYHGPRNPLVSGYRPPALVDLLNRLPYPLLVAQGNCDAPIDAALLNVPFQWPVLFLQYEGLRLLAHHGHQYSRDELLELARRWRVNLCVSGHTHLAQLERCGDLVWVNPGSPSLPKDERPTVALVEEGRVRLLHAATGEVLREEPL